MAEETGRRPEDNYRPRYAEIPTFMRYPIANGPADVDIGLIGIPFDLGVTNRPGARHGPRQVRDMSSFMRRSHHVSLITPDEHLRIGDLGDVPLNPFSIEKCVELMTEYYHRVIDAGTAPLSVGGDHLVSYPILRALGRDRPVGLVHFDAHCDTAGEFLGAKYHHGAPFRLAVEEGVLDPKRVIQIGIRGSLTDPDIWKFSHDSGMRVVYIEEYFDRGGPDWVIEEARKIVGDGPVYVSFDVDGLDPVYAPGTGTPESGGFSMYEAQKMIRGLQGLDIVGGDVVEVSPPFDASGNTALNAATILFEILCVLADARVRARGA
ncbi:MAG: agmatinase [Proteobacteria bacterium]|nr:agmatinase [Pseudomonadota bacterium]